MAGVRLHEPDLDRDVVSDVLENHRNSPLGLEEIDGAAIVVGEGGGLDLQRRVGLRKSEEVLPDVPLDVFDVRQGASREDVVEELLVVLSIPGGGRRLRNHGDGGDAVA